jgi:SPP1 family predicted phage head-tail adaptor
MDSRKFRHRITLQKKTTTENNIGDNVATWSDVTTVWAAVEPLRGKEEIISAQVTSETTHRITVRYRDGLNSHMRIKFGSREFRIESLINLDERNRQLELMCVETEVDN